MRWGRRREWARWVTAGYVIGFLEGTGAHAYFVAADGLSAYDYAPVPIQVLFHALLVLDPLVALLVARARPAGPLLGAAVMLADVLANWWVQWDAVLADPAAHLRPAGTGRPIPYIDQVAPDFPELTIVCGHIGYPWTTEMIAVADKHANVFIDTSAYTARCYPRELVDYLRGRGRRKVLFGTNYPMITPAQALQHLDDLALDEETTDLFPSANARRLFRL